MLLRCDEHFERRRSCLGAVWVVKNRNVSWLATFFNLYMLLNAVRALHSFTPLSVDDYAITSLGTSDSCIRSRARPPPPPSSNASYSRADLRFEKKLFELAMGAMGTLESISHDLQQEVTPQDDLASIMRLCRHQLSATEPSGLQRAKLVYGWVAHSFIGCALLFDVLRWCGCCSAIADAILGFRSHRLERVRGARHMFFLLPLVHLCWLLLQPIELPCCVGTARAQVVLDRGRVLAWLCLLVAYCLFAESHSHGYFLLRCQDGGVCKILRGRLLDVTAGKGEPLSEAEHSA